MEYCNRMTNISSIQAHQKMKGMEAYIPHSFSQPKPSKPWFNTACSRAIHDREVAHERYLSLIRFIFLPRIMPSLFYNLPNTPSLIESVKTFKLQLPLKISGIWLKTSPITTTSSFHPLFLPDVTTAITSI